MATLELKRPAHALPLTLRQVGNTFFAYPPNGNDTLGSFPLNGIKLTQRTPRGAAVSGPDLNDQWTLEYLVHAGNKYLALVEALRNISVAHDDQRVSAIRTVALQALRGAGEL